MKTKKLVALAGCIAATMILSNATWAQVTADVEKASGQDLPTAEQIIADYIKATGGEENHIAIKSMVSSGSLVIEASGQEFAGEVSMTQMAPNKMLLKSTIDQIGSQTQGFDGKTAWLISDREGTVILDGDQLRMTKLQADINQYLNMSKHFSSVECTGEEEFNDEACYVISASNEDSEPLIAYFSKESKLLVGSKVSMETPQATLEMENIISDYRAVGDVKMSFKSVSKNQFFTQVVTMKEIEVNSDVEASMFDLPEEVQELVDDE